MRHLQLWSVITLLLTSFALTGCGSSKAQSSTDSASTATSNSSTTDVASVAQGATNTITNVTANLISLPDGLQYYEMITGMGPAPQSGDIVSIHYVGMLEDGTVFDNSYVRGQPFEFMLGKGLVIRAWDEGVAMMQVGSRGRLVVPPTLGYGEAGADAMVPPNATLYFDVDLVSVRPGAPDLPPTVTVTETVSTPSGLQYQDIVVGTGIIPSAGQLLEVHYTGWLANGRKFDSSLDRGRTLTFRLGYNEVIAGWEEGVATMQVGGERRLIIPANLAYGDAGHGQSVPPGSSLIFDVVLLAAK